MMDAREIFEIEMKGICEKINSDLSGKHTTKGKI